MIDTITCGASDFPNSDINAVDDFGVHIFAKEFTSMKSLPIQYLKSEHKFASTQLDIPEPYYSKILDLASKIPGDLLAEDGRESNPHVTVLFGLHNEDPLPIQRLLAGEPPIELTIGNTSVFSSAETGQDYDVVKLDVESEDLQRLHKLISDNLDNTQTHPEYHPHITLGYLKPGAGEQFVGESILTDSVIVIDQLVFSDKDRGKTIIQLYSSAKSFDESQHPRDNTGKFSDSGESSSAVPSVKLAKGETLYHITAKENLESIQKNGLTSSSEGSGANQYANDVHGVFLANGEQAKVIMQQLEQDGGIDSYQMLEVYLPRGSEVHMDTSMPESAVVSKQDINSKNIKLVDTPRANLNTNFEKEWFAGKSIKGGSGSGNYGHAGRPGERGGSGAGSDRAERAKSTHIPMTKERWKVASDAEAKIAKIIGGEDTNNNKPFDIIGPGNNAWEIKSVLPGAKSVKCTMHPESLERKLTEAATKGYTTHTIVVDLREEKVQYYYKSGLGSFRLSSMEKVSSSQLRKIASDNLSH